MATWTEWRVEPVMSEQFKKRYRRESVIQRRIEFDAKTEEGRFYGILRTAVLIECEGRVWEIEDVLVEPDGLSEYVMVREHEDAQRSAMLSERKFRSYIEAELFVVDQCA